MCLSLLGTFHGGHESEKWHPKKSSIWQVLVSLQALILVEAPMYNEPGHDGLRGTPEGARSSAAYDRALRLQTVRHAMLEPLRRAAASGGGPRAGAFGEVVRAHFAWHREGLRRQLVTWLAEAASGEDEELAGRMAADAAEMCAELDKLAVMS